MKLHLPLSLRKCLLLLFSASTGFVHAGGMNSDVNILTYADFGQNKGRYAVDGGVNELLDAIRQADGGIKFEYQVPEKANSPYIISYEQGMINYSATADIGAYNAISPTFIATVLHNGSQNASFAEKLIGSTHAINYEGIDIRGSDVFRLAPNNGVGEQYDYMIQRQSKLITDVTWNPVTTVESIESLTNEHLYHSGAGVMSCWDEETGTKERIYGPYQYVIGGINNIINAQVHSGTTNISLHQNPNYGSGFGATEQNPVPNSVAGGDSGSPVFIYNEETKQYEYIAAQQSAGGNSYGQARGDVEWTHSTLEAFNSRVVQGEVTTVYLNAITQEGGTLGDDGIGLTDKFGNTATLYSGNATDADGNILATYNGIKSGLNTWSDLSGIKDTQNWYAYGTGYLERSDTELYHNNNLVFDSNHSQTDIVLNATVDLGVGYVEFNKGSGAAGAVSYTIKSEEGKGYLLNSAGFVVNEGASVHIKQTNPETYMREWRKTGAGDLYIDGEGDTNTLLALGGKGTTYLQQQDGHAAYNVLASSGAKVVISDVSQIERDFTFGAGGGTLDMNGNSMDWYTSNGESPREGCFTINALTEEAIITNNGTETSTLVYKESGSQQFFGSFTDSASGGLKIDYQGDGTWTLNGIHTKLTHQDSGLTVSNGSVVLAGINTIHGLGTTDGGRQIDRLVREDDWHYADATMDVSVVGGASFELGSHARLTGTVTVAEGAVYTMREGVKHQMEYVEGGLYRENTYAWEQYYGHKGNTVLNGTMNIEFSDGTTANTTYAGDISGSGNMTVDTADGTLTLTGNNTFSGTREITRGTLIAGNEAAAGSNTYKWIVGEQGVFTLNGADADTALSHIDGSSLGVLALSQNSAQADTSNHSNVIIGALQGHVIQYGVSGTTEELKAVDGVWRLGGGGGELVVNYALTGANKLILGNEYTKGIVTLTNAGNNFSGGIDFMGSGVTLNYTDAAISNVSLNLTYGNRVAMTDLLDQVTADSDGILLQRQTTKDMDMSSHRTLFLGTEGDLSYDGNITVADNQAYRLAAANGTFTVNSQIGGAHDLVVDAQTYTGGTVLLNNISNLSGSVTVMGYDTDKTTLGEGSISLKVSQDNALDSASEVILRAGGTLNIGETTQRINSLTMEAGSSIIGDKLTNVQDTKASELHLTINSMADIKGTINVQTIHKYGTNILELNNGLTSTGNLQYSNLVVEEGDVRLTADYSTIGALNIKGNTLYANGKQIFQGTLIGEDGAVIDVSTSGSSIGGYANVVAANGTVTMNNGSNSVNLAGSVGAAEGAVLKLVGTGEWLLSNAGYNSTGGTLRIENASLMDLTYGYTSTNRGYDTVAIHGTLELDEVTSIRAASDTITQYLTFDTIRLNGQNLALREKSKSATWYIGNLENMGTTASTLTWEASQTSVSQYKYDGVSISDVNSSRLILNNENSFDGTIVAKRTANGKAYNSYVELAHAKAMQNAVLDLQGMDGATMALAVNTDNAQLEGLTGNEYTLAYGGESYHVNQTSAPTSTRDSVLTITGSGGYEYKGAVSGLTIAMEGSGTQTFSGSDVAPANIHALSGKLVFTNSPTVNDSIVLAQGATLQLGSSYSLDSGVTLALVAGNGTQGTMFNELVLNGGTLSFDASALNSSTSLLKAEYSFSSSSGAQNISISNNHLIELNKEYLLLSDADWSSKEAQFSDLPDYMQGNFTYSSDSLKATFGLKDGFSEWKDDYAVFDSANTVLFRDTSAGKSLQFADTVSARALLFVNDESYSFSGEAIALDGKLIMESGKLTLNNKISATTYESSGGELEINSGGELQLTAEQTGSINIDNLSGTGRLSLNLAASDADGNTTYANTLAIDTNFNGTTHVQSGNLSLDNSSSYGSTLQLADGVNVQLSAATTAAGNLVLDGASRFMQQGNTFTVDADVAGASGEWYKTDDGTLIFNKSVSLAALHIATEETTNTFNSTADISRLTLQNNTTLSGSGSLTTQDAGLTEGYTLTVDKLNITDSGTHAYEWNSKTESTFHLLNGAVLDTRNSDYAVTGTLNIGSSADNGTWYINGIQLDNTNKDMSDTSKTKLNIAAGTELVITGDKAGSYDGDFTLANYGEANLRTGSVAEVNIQGTLTSNAAMTLMHNHASVNVENGAQFNLLKGLVLQGVCVGNLTTYEPPSANATINVKNGGRLNATGGTHRDTLFINLRHGATLGNIGEADSIVSYSNNMTLGTQNAKGTVTIDTTALTPDENYRLSGDENAGLTVDMTGTISFAQGSMTTMEVIGNGTLNHKSSFNDAAAISVRKGATLAVGNEHKLNTDTQLNEGTLLLDSATVDGTNASVTINSSGTIRAVGTNAMTAATLLNESATATYDIDANATLQSSGKLSSIGDSSIIKLGDGALHLNNDANALANINVQEGSLQLHGAEQYDLNNLQAAIGVELGFYAGVIGDVSTEANVQISGTAEFAEGVTMNANLLLKTGAVLEVAQDGLAMGSTVTLQHNILLGDDTLTRIRALSAGDSVILFSGVDSLILDSTAYTSITEDDSVLASPYFSNLGSNNYLLTYNSIDNGNISITMMSIPEPTTAMLGLAGLVAFSLRRRRQS